MLSESTRACGPCAFWLHNNLYFIRSPWQNRRNLFLPIPRDFVKNHWMFTKCMNYQKNCFGRIEDICNCRQTKRYTFRQMCIHSYSLFGYVFDRWILTAIHLQHIRECQRARTATLTRRSNEHPDKIELATISAKNRKWLTCDVILPYKNTHFLTAPQISITRMYYVYCCILFH